MNSNSHRHWYLDGDELVLVNEQETFYPTADQIYGCVIENREVFPDVLPGRPGDLPDISFSKYPAHLSAAITYRPGEGDTGLFCSVSVHADEREYPLETIRSRKTDHIVMEGNWYPFSPGVVDEILAIFDAAGIKDVGEITFRQYMHLKHAAQTGGLVTDYTAEQIIHPGIEKSPGEDALQLFEGSLYPYQQDGWQWLSFICQQQLGGILADEMGLGKTVQVIATLATPERSRVVPSLIVATGTLLENWRREIGKFAPSLKVCVHQGPSRTGLPVRLAENDIVVTSYDTVVRDGALFGMIDWKVVVLDEAQAIKNPETKRAMSVKGLNRETGIAVTGTPVENRLRDLWSLMDFALPGYLGEEGEFVKHYEEDPYGASAVEPVVSPVMLRRRVIDVARDLPERIEVPQALLLDDDESAEYERVRQGIIDEYGKSASLVMLTKLRMFCTHPWLLEGTDRLPENPAAFSKFGRFLEIAEEIFENREKVLVFTSYTRMSDLFVSYIQDKYGFYAACIDGRTPIPERQAIVDYFSAQDGPALLALNPKAAGTGLNITAANHVIHYNLEWNPATEDQASARAHRRGQERPVTIHRLFLTGTVEEAIDMRLERKRGIAEAAVVGVEGKEEDIDDIIRALQITPVGRAS